MALMMMILLISFVAGSQSFQSDLGMIRNVIERDNTSGYYYIRRASNGILEAWILRTCLKFLKILFNDSAIAAKTGGDCRHFIMTYSGNLDSIQVL